MPRPVKVTPSRPTPRPSTRSQQPSPGPQRSKVFMNALKQQQSNSNVARGDASDNDNESVCSSSKSSDVVIARPVVKGKGKDEPGVIKAPWRHPDELDYFRPHDWSEDKIITQLRVMVFTVPQPVSGKQSFIEITLYDDGDFDKPRPIKVPRGYRVPLMFVAKFQWASLKLVLTSGQREKEWSDYKFDILHLSRLCERFFSEAQAACNAGVVDIPPIKTRAPEFQVAPGAMSRKWRCPTFDRALARYNKNWLISREEFLRDFYIEFENEEYEKDVLKIDWSRWALKGHKGFKLTQDELKNGIDARMVTRGLKKDDSGKWVWVDDFMIKQEEVAAAVVIPAEEVATVPLPKSSKQGKTPISKPRKDSEPGLQRNGAPSTQSEPPGHPLTPPPLPTDGKSLDAPPQNQLVKPSRHTSSDAPSDHTAKQPSPFVEKFHSPLSSLPSSASPSVAPPSFAEKTAVEKTTTDTPQEPSDPPEKAAANISRQSKPLKIVIPALSPAKPQPCTLSASEEIQHPSSHPPPISSPGRTAQSVEAVDSISPLTPVQPDTSFSEPSQDSILKPEVEEVKPNIHAQRKLTPTSIDSTPNPSPAIAPQDAEEPVDQVEAIPELPSVVSMGPCVAALQVSSVSDNKADSNPPFFGNPTSSLEAPPEGTESTVTGTVEESPPSTPYGPPRPPLSPAEETQVPELDREEASQEPLKEAPQTPKSSNTPTRRPPPVILNPLLPPPDRSRSPSLDEIPGLGGLSSRQPLSLPPQFVAPKMTARTVTDGSSWLMMASSVSSNQVRTFKLEPQEPDLSFMETTEEVRVQNETNGTGDEETHMHSSGRQMVPSRDTDDLHTSFRDRSNQRPSLPTPQSPSTPLSTVQTAQSQTHIPVIEYDDDSDMDFGTPVTSPVIIVPGPKIENIEMLPPPFSPSPSLLNVGIASEEDSSRNQMISPQAPATPKPISRRMSLPDGAASATSSGLQSRTPTQTTPTGISVTQPERSRTPAIFGNPAGSSTDVPITVTSALAQVQLTENTSTSVQASLPAQDMLPLQVPSFPSTSGSTFSQNTLTSSANAQPTQRTAVNNHAFPHLSLPPPRTQIFAPPPAELSHPNGPLTLVPEVRRPSETSFHSPAHHQFNRLDLVAAGGPSHLPHPLQTQPTVLETTILQVPAESTPRSDQHAEVASPTRSLSGHIQPENSMGQMSLSQAMVRHISSFNGNNYVQTNTCNQSVSRKRQREDEDEDGDEVTFKSRKREGLSIREGGVVVRKVVSMVRDTLTGLNDLLEIAAENELIPSERLRASKGKGRAVETPVRDGEESQLYTPVLPSPLVQTPTRPQAPVESSDITRLSEELRSMRAEMTQLKERNTPRESSAENEHVPAMRAELEALREQVRILKETKTNAEPPEVQAMKHELVSLRNEMRSLQDISRRPSIPSVPSAPSTPLTPNVTLRFNNYTMANTIHPLAHLLAVEPETNPPTPTDADPNLRSVPTHIDSDAVQSGTSQPSSALLGKEAERRLDISSSTPHPPVVFDDIPLPVKSKRKARMIFAQRS
ncbi:hypothetical protein D9756_007771 [Leucocoprinus leucothites]|uniref:Uncharacterized protein n=1 Tax=Leucocoprinus leucothites TaxID=201217 RepID=A0A8H5D456_9AGAR|nr:hypothetical protein D9756_007771 [Leucoagaricus leucothites]